MTTDNTLNLPVQPSAAPTTASTSSSADNWRGLTLDEIKRRRAAAYVRLEIGKVQMAHNVDGLKTRVSDNGMRGLLFNNNTIAHLKTADYLLLAFRLSRSLFNAWAKRRSRRRR